MNAAPPPMLADPGGHPMVYPLGGLSLSALEALRGYCLRRLDELEALHAPGGVVGWWMALEAIVRVAARLTTVPPLGESGRLQVIAQLDAHAEEAAKAGFPDLCLVFAYLKTAMEAGHD